MYWFRKKLNEHDSTKCWAELLTIIFGQLCSWSLLQTFWMGFVHLGLLLYHRNYPFFFIQSSLVVWWLWYNNQCLFYYCVQCFSHPRINSGLLHPASYLYCFESCWKCYWNYWGEHLYGGNLVAVEISKIENRTLLEGKSFRRDIILGGSSLLDWILGQWRNLAS